jgi:hypothetical protein
MFSRVNVMGLVRLQKIRIYKNVLDKRHCIINFIVLLHCNFLVLLFLLQTKQIERGCSVLTFLVRKTIVWSEPEAES